MSKPDLAKTLSYALTALSDAAPFALIGGLAVSARAEPRFTRDVDLMIAVADDGSAEAIVRRMLTHRFHTVATIENTKHGRLSMIRLRRSPRDPLLDLLFTSSGIESEVVAAAEPIAVLGHRVPVARVGHLIALKLLARDDKSRPQDAIDLRALAAVANSIEWKRATRAVAMIERRGFARGRDLGRSLARLRG